METYPGDVSVLVNKISSLRKQEKFSEALTLCDDILHKNPNYNVALYHKERILLSMGRYAESILCCNDILSDYPQNIDVLFDKSCNLAMLSKNDESISLLEQIITQDIKYKTKAKNSKFFQKLSDETRFQQLFS